MGIIQSKGAAPVKKAQTKKVRDLYQEMMRQEFPDFAAIPEADLVAAVAAGTEEPPAGANPPTAGEGETGKADAGKADADAGDSERYDCTTQDSGTLEELFLGLQRGNVTLWRNGSVINWTARADGYPSSGMALEAAQAVYNAATEWNTALAGRVTFKYVSVFDDAAFTLSFNDTPGRTLARAFFPDQHARTMNLLQVFARQYQSDVRRHFVATMRHELGHILGLRHEHSHSGIKDWLGPGQDLKPEDQPGGAESIIWGSRNPRSVMAYYRGQTIQQSDIDAIRDAYDQLTNGRRITGTGRFGVITKRIVRVDPNN